MEWFIARNIEFGEPGLNWVTQAGYGNRPRPVNYGPDWFPLAYICIHACNITVITTFAPFC